MKNFYQFLHESDFKFADLSLNEDYANQAATNQLSIARNAERMQKVKEKAGSLDESTEKLKERASETKDADSKAIYAAKIACNDARKESYSMYLAYLKSMNIYYNSKGSEIKIRAKAAEKNKL